MRTTPTEADGLLFLFPSSLDAAADSWSSAGLVDLAAAARGESDETLHWLAAGRSGVFRLCAFCDDPEGARLERLSFGQDPREAGEEIASWEAAADSDVARALAADDDSKRPHLPGSTEVRRLFADAGARPFGEPT